MPNQPKKPLDEDARELVRRARKLLRRVGGDGLQSSAVREGVEAEVARIPGIDGELTNESVQSAGPSTTAKVVAHDVVKAAQEAIDLDEDQGTTSNLTDFQFASLEAIVHLTGRPAIRYVDGGVQMPPNDVGDNERWRTFIAAARAKIDGASASVGQVGFGRPGMPPLPDGTAWRLGDDLVVTNRHVARDFVSDSTIDPSLWTLDPAKGAVVDFTITDNATSVLQFAVAELVYCAADDSVDLAIFRLKKNGALLPAALTLDFDPDSVGRNLAAGFHGEEIYVVGHPYRENASNETQSVFGIADGFKRCSPGRVTIIPTREHAFEHDASTLGGNSGSCVLSVAAHTVIGLHYGGLEVSENGVGRANVALGLARLGNHRAAEILRNGHP